MLLLVPQSTCTTGQPWERAGKEWRWVPSPGYGCARVSTGICPSGQEAKKWAGQSESAEILQQVKLCSIEQMICAISRIIFPFTAVYTSKRLLICLQNPVWWQSFKNLIGMVFVTDCREQRHQIPVGFQQPQEPEGLWDTKGTQMQPKCTEHEVYTAGNFFSKQEENGEWDSNLSHF